MTDVPDIPPPPLAGYVATLKRIAAVSLNPDVKVLALQLADQLQDTFHGMADKTTAALGNTWLDLDRRFDTQHQDMQRLTDIVASLAKDVQITQAQGDMVLQLLKAMGKAESKKLKDETSIESSADFQFSPPPPAEREEGA